MPVFLFFSPIQFVRSFSFVIGENDNYLPLVLFPFLVSSWQNFHWIEFQRLFLWKKNHSSWHWQNGRGETRVGFYFTRFSHPQRLNSMTVPWLLPRSACECLALKMYWILHYTVFVLWCWLHSSVDCITCVSFIDLLPYTTELFGLGRNTNYS